MPSILCYVLPSVEHLEPTTPPVFKQDAFEQRNDSVWNQSEVVKLDDKDPDGAALVSCKTGRTWSATRLTGTRLPGRLYYQGRLYSALAEASSSFPLS